MYYSCTGCVGIRVILSILKKMQYLSQNIWAGVYFHPSFLRIVKLTKTCDFKSISRTQEATLTIKGERNLLEDLTRYFSRFPRIFFSHSVHVTKLAIDRFDVEKLQSYLNARTALSRILSSQISRVWENGTTPVSRLSNKSLQIKLSVV